MTRSPIQQQERFFHWFAKMGIYRFDLQLRVPSPDPESTTDSWQWLRPSLDISVGEVFLKYSKWIRFMNSKGADVYIRPHGEADHRTVFLDDLSLEKALQVSEKYAACVVCTSENNTQVWLATDKKLSKVERKSVQSWMRNVGYTDPGSVSGDHLGRLCGVRSQKRKCWVNLTTTTFGERYSPKIEQPLSSPMGEACVSPFPFREGVVSGKRQSPSEHEFGWALGALKHGIPMINVINRLTALAKNRGKRQPELYANRTVMGAYRVLHPGS